MFRWISVQSIPFNVTGLPMGFFSDTEMFPPLSSLQPKDSNVVPINCSRVVPAISSASVQCGLELRANDNTNNSDSTVRYTPRFEVKYKRIRFGSFLTAVHVFTRDP